VIVGLEVDGNVGVGGREGEIVGNPVANVDTVLGP
jgi:hypothetical protein